MRVELLGAYIDALNMDETVDRVDGFVRSGRPHRVITLNPEYLYRAQNNRDLLELANSADLVTPDGTGIVLACKIANFPVPERVTGIDLMLSLCERGSNAGWRIFLLGAAPGVAEEAAEKLKQQYPGLVIAGIRDGYFKNEESEQIAEEIRNSNSQLLFVALGMPKQEQWIAQYQPKMGVPCAIGVGGSFDVISGRKQRAPQWTIKLKVEWLYRLIKEPSRLKRQLVLPKFAALVVRRYLLKI